MSLQESYAQSRSLDKVNRLCWFSGRSRMQNLLLPGCFSVVKLHGENLKAPITLCFWFAFVNKNARKTRVKRE